MDQYYLLEGLCYQICPPNYFPHSYCEIDLNKTNYCISDHPNNAICKFHKNLIKNCEFICK
jgi:hypothetical protein